MALAGPLGTDGNHFGAEDLSFSIIPCLSMVPSLLRALDNCWSGQQCNTQSCGEPFWRETESVCRGHNLSMCLLCLSAGHLLASAVHWKDNTSMGLQIQAEDRHVLVPSRRWEGGLPAEGWSWSCCCGQLSLHSALTLVQKSWKSHHE